jgi:hypothetical protein
MRAILFLVFAMLLFSSCKKDNLDIIGEWEVEAIRTSQTSGWIDAPEIIVFYFEKKGKMAFDLSVNRCITSYSSCTCGSFSVEIPACTEACCDSEFSTQILEILSEIGSHEISADELLLKGISDIKLQRKK